MKRVVYLTDISEPGFNKATNKLGAEEWPYLPRIWDLSSNDLYDRLQLLIDVTERGFNWHR